MKEYRIIVEKPEKQFGIYAWINEEDKMVYVGESCDLNNRLCQHIRSMYSMEETSNKNLINAFINLGKSFIGMAVKYATTYNKVGGNSEKEWLIDETIYMYAFVQKGYRLYNGEEEIYKDGTVDYPNTLNDNTGAVRSFLRDSKDKIYDNLHDYCENIYKDKYDKIKIDERIQKALDNVDNILRNIPPTSINTTDYYIFKDNIDNNKIIKLCNEISRVYLQKDEVAEIGLSPISIENLINMVDNHAFDKIAVCGFGNYLNQSAITILRTKQYDIAHNTLSVEGNDINIDERKNDEDPGICFWAFGRADPENYRKYLSTGETDRSPRYLLLPYVQSDSYATTKNGDNHIFNPTDGDSIEDFFKRMNNSYNERYEDVRKKLNEYNQRIANAKKQNDKLEEWNIIAERDNYRAECDSFAFGYAWNRKNADNKTGIKKKYPASMFPEIIEKVSRNTIRVKNNVAFLISELGYIDASIDASELYEYFTSNTSEKLTKTLHSQNNVACAELSNKNGLKKYLLNYLKSYSDNDGEIKLFLAKLEYPYIVALVRDPF